MNDLILKDFVDRKALEKIQLARLQDTVTRLYENVEFYHKAFDEKGVKPRDLVTLADLAKFPTTIKTDLRDHYPFGLLAVPQKDIVRIHASSGTTGKPTVVCYTKKDIEIWAETMARALICGGATEDDIIQVGYGYGLFTGGLGAHYGAERLGASVIPMGGGSTEKQLMLIRDFGTTVICCTPSFFIHLIEEAEKIGLDLHDTKLRIGVFGAEPWTEGMRDLIQQKTGIKAHDVFGLSEIMGPGVAMDCEAHDGLHIFEDHYYPEILNPDTGEVMPPGEEGELTLTTITKEGMPLLRYRTHDISRLIYEKCSCGRTLVRMEKVRRRSDDMLIIRGVNVFPSQIETVLINQGYAANYQIIVDRVNHTDTLDVQVEMTPEMFTDNMGEIAARQKKLVEGLRSMLGLTAKVTLVAPKTIVRSEGKAVRVIDKRKI